MATIEVGGEAGGKKSVDSPIPLIPFIDLLLCCVMFLLVTAVWNQLASHDVSQQLPGQTTSDAIWEPEVRLVLQVTSDGYVVASTAGDRIPIPKNGDRYDVATLRERLPSVDLRTGEAAPARYERSDTTAVQRLVVRNT